jgi:hypothetical protein
LNFAFGKRFGGLTEIERIPNFHALSLQDGTLSLREAEIFFGIFFFENPDAPFSVDSTWCAP